jgi:hypothetical protein
MARARSAAAIRTVARHKFRAMACNTTKGTTNMMPDIYEVSAEPYCGQRTDLNPREAEYATALLALRETSDREVWRRLRNLIRDDCVRVSRWDRFTQISSGPGGWVLP